MSKNNKNAKRHDKAREMSKLRLSGGSGPAKTVRVNTKRWGYRDNPEVAKRIAEMLKATQEGPKANRTAGKKILAGAGGAAQAQSEPSAAG